MGFSERLLDLVLMISVKIHLIYAVHQESRVEPQPLGEL